MSLPDGIHRIDMDFDVREAPSNGEKGYLELEQGPVRSLTVQWDITKLSLGDVLKHLERMAESKGPVL